MAQKGAMEGIDIRVVVLVGRRSFGRCPISSRVPAALWPVAGKPVLERLLQHLADEGIGPVKICCDEEVADSVRAIRADDRLAVDLVIEELSSGTAGCLRDAVAEDPGDLIVVLSGSILCPPSIRDLIEAHTGADADLTMAFNSGPQGSRPAEIYLCRRGDLPLPPAGAEADSGRWVFGYQGRADSCDSARWRHGSPRRLAVRCGEFPRSSRLFRCPVDLSERRRAASEGIQVL